MVSDETAYRKYLAGDEAAAQLLVERYGDALTLYINGVLGDIHEAEDLMIEAFAHIFARERPIQDGCFKAYLYKTGRNLALRCKTRRRFFQKPNLKSRCPALSGRSTPVSGFCMGDFQERKHCFVRRTQSFAACAASKLQNCFQSHAVISWGPSRRA